MLLYEDRAVIPKQLRQIILDSIHLTHPRQITAAQNCQECRVKGKSLQVITGKKHFTGLDAVVEPYEKIQLDFAGPLPDENNKDVYILVGVDSFSRFLSTKVVANNKADRTSKFMQTHMVNHGVPRNIRCDQA